jgi:hypothetical protein
MPFVVFPIASVAVAIGPLVNTVAMLIAVLPIASVAVAIVETAIPHHVALTVSLAIFQLSFVDTFRKDKLSLGLLHFLKL